MDQTQLELDIADYLIMHGDELAKDIKSLPIPNFNKENYNKYQYLIQEQYEQIILQYLRERLNSALHISMDILFLIINKKFINIILGDKFLKYEQL